MNSLLVMVALSGLNYDTSPTEEQILSYRQYDCCPTVKMITARRNTKPLDPAYRRRMEVRTMPGPAPILLDRPVVRRNGRGVILDLRTRPVR